VCILRRASGSSVAFPSPLSSLVVASCLNPGGARGCTSASRCVLDGPPRQGTTPAGAPSQDQPRARMTLDDFLCRGRRAACLPACLPASTRLLLRDEGCSSPSGTILCSFLGRSTPLFPPIINININQHPTPLPLPSPSRTSHPAACLLFPLHSDFFPTNTSAHLCLSVCSLAKDTHPRTPAHRTHTLANLVSPSGTTLHHNART
jgi:hypothetical protein